MVVDNFELVSQYLDFQSTDDMYVVEVLLRKKDLKEEGPLVMGVGHSNKDRTVKLFILRSKDEYIRRIPEIMFLCDKLKARAYFLPQVRSFKKCLSEISKKCIDNMILEDSKINIYTIMNSAICANHESRSKRWVFDLDNEFIDKLKVKDRYDQLKTLTQEECVEVIAGDIRRVMEESGSKTGIVWINPTRNGFHIISSKFDVRKLRFHEITDKDVMKHDNLTLLYCNLG